MRNPNGQAGTTPMSQPFPVQIGFPSLVTGGRRDLGNAFFQLPAGIAARQLLPSLQGRLPGMLQSCSVQGMGIGASGCWVGLLSLIGFVALHTHSGQSDLEQPITIFASCITEFNFLPLAVIALMKLLGKRIFFFNGRVLSCCVLFVLFLIKCNKKCNSVLGFQVNI